MAASAFPCWRASRDALENARISVFLCNGADDPDREREHVEQLLAKRVDGIIVTARRADPRPPLNLRERRSRSLYAFAQVADPKALCLLPDDSGGGRLAGEHLIAPGAGGSRISPDPRLRGGAPSSRRAAAGAGRGGSALAAPTMS